MRTLHAYTVLFVSALLLIASVTFYADAQEEKKKGFDPKTPEPILDIFRKSPAAIPLDARDPSLDLPALVSIPRFRRRQLVLNGRN